MIFCTWGFHYLKDKNKSNLIYIVCEIDSVDKELSYICMQKREFIFFIFAIINLDNKKISLSIFSRL